MPIKDQLPNPAATIARRSQLWIHEAVMGWQSIRVPVQSLVVCWAALFIVAACCWLAPEVGLILARVRSSLWLMMGANPAELLVVALPDGRVMLMPVGSVGSNSLVAAAVETGVQLALLSLLAAWPPSIAAASWWVRRWRKRDLAMIAALRDRHIVAGASDMDGEL